MRTRLAALLVFFAPAALAAVAKDSENPSNIGFGCVTCASPQTFTFTNTAGGLIVCGITSGGGAGDFTAVSYDGAALAEKVSITNAGNEFADLWWKLTPSTGSLLTLSLTFPGPRDTQAGCITTTGHDTGTPLNATSWSAQANAASPASVSVTGTTTGSMVVAASSTGTCFGAAGNCAAAPIGGAGQTLTWLLNQGPATAGSNGVMTFKAGDGTTFSMTHALSGPEFWTIVALEVMPSAGGAAPPSPQGGFYLPLPDFLPRGGTLGRGKLSALRTKFLFDPLAGEDLIDVSASWLTPETILTCQVLDEVPMSVSVVERGTGTAKLLVSTSLIGPADPVQVQCIGGTTQ